VTFANQYLRRPALSTGWLVFVLFSRISVLESADGTISEPATEVGTVPNRLTPVLFTSSRPKDYTDENLNEALRQKLTAEELALVVNPLKRTPEMDRWALELTGGATNDLQKAKLLYDALVTHASAKPTQFRESPTAQDVFQVWNTPGASFRCQDFTFLYVALARSVGLRAYDVFVEMDCHGTELFHGCAAVFIGEKALLVDPAYSWFGVPHKNFTVLDDLQSAAVFLSEKEDLEPRQVAAKLAPDFSIIQVNLTEKLANAGRLKEAREEVDIMIRQHPEAGMTYYARAFIAWKDGKLQRAVELDRKAIALAPQTESLHYLLAYVLLQQGKRTEARESYQNVLRCALSERFAEPARQMITWINEIEAVNCYGRGYTQAITGNWAAALTNLDQAIGLRNDYPEAYLVRGTVQQAKGDFDAALENFEKAIRLKPDLAEAYFNRGSVKLTKSDLSGAFIDYNEAIKLNSELISKTVPALGMLGCRHYDRQQFTNALVAFGKACELSSSYDYVRFRIWLIRSRLGQTGAATKELKAYLDKRKTANGEDWAANIGEFLVGELPESALFKAAESRDKERNPERFCEAWFYAGTKRLIAGDKRTATTYFETCIATGAKDLTEYSSAAAELRFLKERTQQSP
jgi:lipoprotein NlpI